MPDPKWRRAREKMRREGLTEDEIDERESAQGDIEDHLRREERDFNKLGEGTDEMRKG